MFENSIKYCANNKPQMNVYVCDVCNACYTLEKSLKLHRRSHKTFICDVCKSIFFSKGDFITHCQSHAVKEVNQESNKVNHSVFAHLQDSCNAKYTQESDLAAHCFSSVKDEICQESSEINSLNIDQTEKSKNSFICELCNTKYNDKISLEAHTKKDTVVCVTCSKSFDSKCSQQAHNCQSIKVYVCDMCNSSYTTQKSLKLHRRYHKTYRCDLCEKIFSLKSDLTMHYHHLHKIKKFAILDGYQGDREINNSLHGDHFQNSKKSFICAVCHGKYNDSTSFKFHTEKSTLICENCDKIFDSVCSLIVHNKSHSFKGYVCNICNKSFKLKTSLKKHHLSHEIFTCNICKKNFSSESDLTSHSCSHSADEIHQQNNEMDSLSVSQLHSSVTSDICNKKYFFLKTHTDKNMMTCKDCYKDFDSECSLLNHICINSVKGYPCDVCNVIFMQESSLKEHHCSPVTCDFCRRNFSSESDFISHHCSLTIDEVYIENNEKDLLTADPPENLTKLVASSICNTEYNVDISLKMQNEKICESINTVIDSECSPQNHNSVTSDACFIQENSLKEHSYSQKMFICGVCKKNFFSKNDLTSHHCSLVANGGCQENREQCSDHLLNAVKEKNKSAKEVFTCNICNTKYSDNVSLNAHKEKNALICEICKESFDSECRLQAHNCIFSDAEELSCVKCEKVFLEKSLLKMHQNTCTGKTTSCKISNLVSEDQNTLKNHFEKHNNENLSVARTVNKEHKDKAIKSTDDSFSCHLCNKIFATKTLFACHNCIFKSREMYKLKGALVIQLPSQASQKQRNVAKVTLQNFVCKFFERKFSTKENLELHYHTHTIEKQFKCDICEETFSCKTSIKAHYEKHITVKKYVCNICKKCFKGKKEFKIHYSFHKGKKKHYGERGIKN